VIEEKRRTGDLDRLPIADQPSLLFLGIEPIAIKQYQIAVWVSINDVLRPNQPEPGMREALFGRNAVKPLKRSSSSL